MDAKDRDALERCMAKAMEDPSRAEQLRNMMTDTSGCPAEPWERVARFVCYGVQSRALSLMPHQWPPEGLSTNPDDEPPQNRQGVILLNRMLAAGLSRYEPDPLAAVAEAEAERE